MNGGHVLNEVADGIYRLGTRWVSYYLVREDSAGVLIDAGYPRYLPRLESALGRLGMSPRSLEAVFVTHHHVDHAGTAGALHQKAGVPVFVGDADAPIVRGERPSHPPAGFYRQTWRPSMIRYLAHTVRVGGAGYSPSTSVRVVDRDQALELPGGPRVVMTPGHTAGHYSVFLPSSRTLCVGDALVNFDYAAGQAGVRLHRFNENPERANASLDILASLSTDLVLFGHGDPWGGQISEAIALARNRP